MSRAGKRTLRKEPWAHCTAPSKAAVEQPRLPPPLWGRDGWGVVPRGTAVPYPPTPTPDPSPQGGTRGREEFAALLRRKLRPCGAYRADILTIVSISYPL